MIDDDRRIGANDDSEFGAALRAGLGNRFFPECKSTFRKATATVEFFTPFGSALDQFTFTAILRAFDAGRNCRALIVQRLSGFAFRISGATSLQAEITSSTRGEIVPGEPSW